MKGDYLSIERMNLGKGGLRNGYAGTVKEILPLINIPLHQVMASKISIPNDMLAVSSIDELRCRLQTTAVIFKGGYNCIAMYMLS